MGPRIFQVDAFTGEPFKGNPAAVCLLNTPREDSYLAHVAREMNLSETAFLLPEGRGYRLRWFTPTVEVALCGHATLATSHVLWEEGIVPPQKTIHFSTMSGTLHATRRGGFIELDFPARPPQQARPPDGLLEALAISPLYVGRCDSEYVILLRDEEEVRAVEPDFRLLKATKAQCVMITARADSPRYDFVSRFFGPGLGIDEDPVTGSAHCCLGPFWAARLGRRELRAYQASARGGELVVRVEGERVYLAGKAVTVFRGELLV